MRALARRHLIVRFRLDSMDDIGELDRVLNEEYRDCNRADEQLESLRTTTTRTVIADDIPIALVRVEFNSKASNVTDGVLLHIA